MNDNDNSDNDDDNNDNNNNNNSDVPAIIFADSFFQSINETDMTEAEKQELIDQIGEFFDSVDDMADLLSKSERLTDEEAEAHGIFRDEDEEATDNYVDDPIGSFLKRHDPDGRTEH